MKRISILFLLIGSLCTYAQNSSPNVRSIEVKGSSEIEVTPDEIFVRITLKEYKKGSQKVDLSLLESGLVKSLRKLNIPEENLTVENVYGYNWNWRKRKPEDFMGSKSFLLKVSDVKQMGRLTGMLDPEGLNNMNVKSYSHSNIEGLRKQVKIGAMKAAKDKAAYLLQSVGASLGTLRQVQEIDYGYQSPMMNMRSNVAYESADAGSYQSNVEFMKVKVRAEMRVVFDIE